MPVFNMYGGGSGLDINIKEYATLPQTAEENTIGVLNASVSVKNYAFSSIRPTQNISSGFLWIKTGTSSNTPIPADADEKVMLYPIGAQLYDGRYWNVLTSDYIRCYQNGEWKDWKKRLYTAGTQNVSWTAYYSSFQSDCMYVGRTSEISVAPRIYTTSTVDITLYRFLCVEYMRDADDLSSDRFIHGISDIQAGAGEDYFLRYASGASKTRITSKLQIESYTGERYIKLSNNSGAQTSKKLTYVYNVWLEA